MACVYEIDGVPNQPVTDVIDFIDDHQLDPNLTEKVLEMLDEELDILQAVNKGTDDEMHLIIEGTKKDIRLKFIADINTVLKESFSITNGLIVSQLGDNRHSLEISKDLGLQINQGKPNTDLEEGIKAEVEEVDVSIKDMSMEDIIEELVTTKERYVLTPNGKYYKNQETGDLYERVSSFISKGQSNPLFDTLADIDKKNSFNIEEVKGEWLVSIKQSYIDTFDVSDEDAARIVLIKTATLVGNNVDMVIRDFFNGNLKSYEEYSENASLSNPFIMGKGKSSNSKVEFANFIKSVNELKKRFDKNGERVLSNKEMEEFEIVLHDDELGVAGTVDLLTVDKEGNFKIYDIKTTRHLNDVDTKYYGGLSKREKWSQQVSMYRILLSNSYGIVASPDSAVIPVFVDYANDNPNFNARVGAAPVKLSITDKVGNAVRKGADGKGSAGHTIGQTVQKNADIVVDLLRTSVESQKQLLERSVESEENQDVIATLQNLERHLRKIEKGNAVITDFVDFINFAESTVSNVETLLNQIERKHELGSKSYTSKERLKMLQDIMEARALLQSFYSEESSKNILGLLSLKVGQLSPGTPLSDVLISTANKAQLLSSRYVEIAIPIQAHYLHSFAPIQINEDLDAKIAHIRDTNTLDGLSRRDIRYGKAAFTLNANTRRAALVELNILQLKEKKIGTESLIRELTETFKDTTVLSAFADPLVYSSENSIQLFAAAVKDALVKAHDATIEFKYELQPAFQKFRAWKTGSSGYGESNTAKFYEDIIEIITVSRLNHKTGKYEKIRVLSFVQEYDIAKFSEEKEIAFKALREKHNYPKDYTELEDWFTTDDGRLYSSATVRWYDDNTVPIASAEKEIADLEAARDKVYRRIGKQYNAAKTTQEGKKINESLWMRYNNLTSQLNRVVRNGKPIGKLSRPNKSFLNTKYENMPSEAKEYQEVLLKMYGESQKKVKSGGLHKNSWDDISYLLPAIRKSAYEYTVIDGVPSSVRNLANDSILLQETDTEFGEMLDMNGESTKLLPIFYSKTLDEKEISRDVTNSVIKYADMANRFEAKSKIQGMVVMMQSIVGSRDMYSMATTGDLVTNSLASGIGIEQFKTTDGKKSNTYKQLESFIDNVFYGMSEKEDASVKLGRAFSRQQAANTAISYTAIAVLSANALQFVNQYVLDEITGIQDAIGKQFFSAKDLAWAKAKMSIWSGMDGGLGVIKEGIVPKFLKQNKISKFEELFDVMQSYGDRFGGETGSALKKRFTSGVFFLPQHAADYRSSLNKALAMAHSYGGKLKDSKGKVIQVNGKDANLWDVLIEDERGKLMVDPRVANFDKTRFMARMHGMLKKSNQLKGNFDKTLIDRTFLGKFLVLFKKFFMPHYRKRFGHAEGGAHVDIETATIQQGYYTSFLEGLSNAYFQMRSGEFGKALATLMAKGKTKEVQQNQRRLAFEAVAVYLLGMLSTALGKMLDDDDDLTSADTYALNFSLYQVLRLQTELNQFRSPSELARFVQDPTAVTSPVIKGARLLYALHLYFQYNMGIGGVEESDIFYQRASGEYEKGDLKLNKSLVEAIPVIAGLSKSSDPARAAKWFDLNK